MNEKKLDSVILGLLSHEELTGYEIKKRMDGALSYFWGASYGAIYPTLAQLEKEGLAVKHSEDDTRTKMRYSITDKGREHLKEWLSIPVQKDEIRYETLLKLFFGNAGDASQAKEHIARFREKTEQSLNELRAAERTLSEHLGEDDAHRYYLLTVRFGIRSYEAYLEWCDEAEAMIGGI